MNIVRGLRDLLFGNEAHARALDRRAPWGKGTGRGSYDVVQRRRATNRRARAARRINRRPR